MSDSDNNIYSVISKIISFSFISTLFLSIALLMFAIYHDYIFFELYQASLNLQSTGMINALTMASIETILNHSTVILTFMDAYFMFGFVIFVSTTFFASYRVKRLGHFSLLGFLTFGVMAWLFITSIIYQLSDWLKTNIINGILVNFASDLPLYTFYMSHYGLINLIILMICLILNFIDFNNIKFNTRKNKEFINDEL